MYSSESEKLKKLKTDLILAGKDTGYVIIDEVLDVYSNFEINVGEIEGFYDLLELLSIKINLIVEGQLHKSILKTEFIELVLKSLFNKYIETIKKEVNGTFQINEFEFNKFLDLYNLEPGDVEFLSKMLEDLDISLVKSNEIHGTNPGDINSEGSSVSAPSNSIFEYLINVYDNQGYLLENEIIDTLIQFSVELDELNDIYDKLFEKGVIILNFPPSATKIERNFKVQKIYDKSKLNYNHLYNKAEKIEPSLKPYISYLRSIIPPQPGEIESLIIQAKDGNEYARNRIIDMYLKISLKSSLHYSKITTLPLSDLIQYANLGLIKSISKYETGVHSKFSVFAGWWIRQSLTRSISDFEPLIRIPIHMLETINKMSQLTNKLLIELGRNPSPEEIAELMELTVEKVHEIKQIPYVTSSLETYEFDDSNFSIYNKFVDLETTSPFDAVAIILLKEQLDDILDTLTEREENVLRLRFGLDDDHTRTLEELGKVFGVTRERIRQIEASALRKLRHPSRSKRIQDFY